MVANKPFRQVFYVNEQYWLMAESELTVGPQLDSDRRFISRGRRVS